MDALPKGWRDLGSLLLAALIVVLVVNVVAGLIRNNIDPNTVVVSVCSLAGVVYGIWSKHRESGGSDDDAPK